MLYLPIEKFYNIYTLDEEFDEAFYLTQCPEAQDFYQPYCKNQHISDKRRLFYHYLHYGKKYNLYKNLEEMHAKLNISYDRKIYIKVKNGLANRLRTINSFFNLAHKAHAELFVCWVAGQGFSSEHFLDLFRPIEGIKFISYDTYQEHSHSSTNLDQLIIKNETFGDFYAYKDCIANILDVIHNQSFCYDGDSCLEYMMPSFFNIANNDNTFFKLLMPIKHITEQIHKIPIDSNTIGVHIRRGDASQSPWKHNYNQSTDESFIIEIDNCIRDNRDTKIFLATDCKKTQDKFISLYPNRILVNPQKRFFHSQDIYAEKPYQEDAVVDLFCLAHSAKIIGTHWSSFSNLAGTLSSQEVIIAKTSTDTSVLSQSNKPFHTEKISLICAVKNREESLMISLQSWLQYKNIYEFIIVDWSSAQNLTFISKIDKRIKVIRVNDESYFHLAKAYNLALKAAVGDWIIKMDAEYVLNPYYNIFDEYILNHNEFLTGAWQDRKLDPNGFLEPLNGFIVSRREPLLDVNGYNEKLHGYGYDDCDLYARLTKKGLVRTYLNHNQKCIFHIPHPDSKRVENYECKNLKLSLDKNYERAYESTTTNT